MSRNAPRLAVPLSEYRDRFQRLVLWMRSQELDLLILTKPELYSYFGGYDPTSTFYFQALIVDADSEEPVLMLNKAEELLALETTWVDDMRVVWTHEDHYEKLKEIAQSLGRASPRRLGLNLDSYYFSAAQYLGVRSLFPDAEVVDITKALDDMRLIKSRNEIEHLRRAAHVADLGVTAGINAIHEGVNDTEVLAAVQSAVALNQGEFPAYPTLVDARGTLHGRPIGRPIRSGDTVYLEVSGVIRRYHCNISRTVVVGEPSPEVKDLHSVVKEALDRGTAAMQPGAKVSDVLDVVDEIRGDYVENTWGRIGFSMELAYPPIWIGSLSLMKGDDHVLEPGMVVTIEPGLSYSNGQTVMIGNNVLITEHGPEVLNNVPSTLFVR